MSASDRDGIWLLDDDASMLKALGRLLTSAGFAVEKFSHPAEFLSNLEHARCRVAVLDVWMPDMNGLEVQARLRRESPETRIILSPDGTIRRFAKPRSRQGLSASWRNRSRTKLWCNSFTKRL